MIAQTKMADLQILLAPVGAEMVSVERRLSTNLIDDNPFIGQLLSQTFSAGGKRIRPGLVLLSYHAASRAAAGGQSFDGGGDGCGGKACTVDAEQPQIILAVLTELIHSASLVHDDVIDRADTRRGHVTAHNKWSERVAVLLGDLLFAQASMCLAQLRSPEIVGIYGRVLGDLCAGEIKQASHHYALDLTWDDYIHKSYCKTASLFSAGCRSAAILAGADSETVASFAEYGKNLGICFQIVDDLLDVTGSSLAMGKSTGGDLAQGIITAPVLAVLKKPGAESTRLAQLIGTRQVNAGEGLAEALQIIDKNGGAEMTQQLCRRYADGAKANLKTLHSSQCRDALVALVDYLLHRLS